MTKHLSTRGLIVAHANANSAGMLNALNSAFGEFKQKHGGDISSLQIEMDRINADIAAMRLGGGGEDRVSNADNRRAQAALVEFMRHGRPDAMQAITPMAEMKTDGGPEGGFTVPKEIDQTIQDQMLEISPIRGLASVVTTGTSDYHKLVNKRGGASGWAGERDPRTETDTPSLGDIKPPMGELWAYPSLTNWMMDDSQFNLEMFIRDNVTDEFALQESTAFVTGDGNNKPLGIMSVDTSETGDDNRAFGTLQFVKTGVAAALSDATHNGVDALIDLVHSVKPSYRAGPGVGWLMNSTTASLLRKMKTLGDTEHYLWQSSTIEGRPDSLLGYPVFECEDMPDVGGNAFPIAFGNWRKGYLIVDRIGTKVVRDPYTKPGWIRLYISKRVGGAPTDTKAIKLLKVAA
ncbi:MAG: phage major capsid protein [Rhizobiaceae bacterium]|nr:phage major capsid protein [Rhizobiaceae bacterium]